MARPRQEQINIENTPYYHIVSRCVRRAFLCGFDTVSGQSFEHRRSWIESRIRLLSSLFGIDICGYAVMSNHMHLVVKLDPTQIDALTLREVAHRWSCLFKGSTLFQQWLNNGNLDSIQQNAVTGEIQVYRSRLKNLGWFMKCLNEPIARKANKEDNCTGHFWESRYKSYALLTEDALLNCMAYVDSNPMRASMADAPESSNFTSIKERITQSFDLNKAVAEQLALGYLLKFDVPLKPLVSLEACLKYRSQSGVLFGAEDYLDLVNYSANGVRDRFCGMIAGQTFSVLNQLDVRENSG